MGHNRHKPDTGEKFNKWILYRDARSAMTRPSTLNQKRNYWNKFKPA